MLRPWILRGAVLVVVAVTTGFLAISGPHTAFAASDVPSTVETPITPSPSAEPRVAAVIAPVITSPSAGAFIGSSTVTVSGTRDASSEVQLLSPTGGDPLCIIAPDGTEQWSCPNAALPNSADVALRIVATGDSTLVDEITVMVLGAPTVAGGVSNGLVRGTGYPGASVVVSVPSIVNCTTTADASGAWACYLAGVTTSGNRTVSARQSASYSGKNFSNSSTPVSIAFDVDRPTAPVISTPSAGARIPVAGAMYSGTGESAATVTVFAGPYSVCTARVSGGAWTCSAGGVAAGSYSLIAVQQDAAGNVSPGSSPARVSYVKPTVPPSSGTPTPSPTSPPAATVPQTSSPSASSAPSSSADSVPVVPEPTPSPAPSPSASSSIPASGFVPGGWNAPTRFTAAVSSPFTSAAFPWLQAVLLALGAVLLFAIPSRLLAGTISRARGGRPLWGATAIAGRNRARDEFETAPAVEWNRWLLGVAALVAAATLVLLSGPVVSQPAYLRLLVAVIGALLIVNIAAAVVPLVWSTRVMRVDATLTFLPRYLVLVAATAIGSRVLDIQPALLFALLGSITVAAGPTIAQRGQLGAVRAASLLILGIVSWTVLGVLPAATGFASNLLAEMVNTVVLAAIGSAVLVLIPLGRTSGRSVLAWSPLAWAGLMVTAFTLLFAVLSPVIDVWQSAGTVPLLWVAAGVFAALSGGAWAWQRFVAPAGL